jgi:hypothetical protein
MVQRYGSPHFMHQVHDRAGGHADNARHTGRISEPQQRIALGRFIKRRDKRPADLRSNHYQLRPKAQAGSQQQSRANHFLYLVSHSREESDDLDLNKNAAAAISLPSLNKGLLRR